MNQFRGERFSLPNNQLNKKVHEGAKRSFYRENKRLIGSERPFDPDEMTEKREAAYERKLFREYKRRMANKDSPYALDEGTILRLSRELGIPFFVLILGLLINIARAEASNPQNSPAETKRTEMSSGDMMDAIAYAKEKEGYDLEKVSKKVAQVVNTKEDQMAPLRKRYLSIMKEHPIKFYAKYQNKAHRELLEEAFSKEEMEDSLQKHREDPTRVIKDVQELAEENPDNVIKSLKFISEVFTDKLEEDGQLRKTLADSITKSYLKTHSTRENWGEDVYNFLYQVDDNKTLFKWIIIDTPMSAGTLLNFLHKKDSQLASELMQLGLQREGATLLKNIDELNWQSYEDFEKSLESMLAFGSVSSEIYVDILESPNVTNEEKKDMIGKILLFEPVLIEPIYPHIKDKNLRKEIIRYLADNEPGIFLNFMQIFKEDLSEMGEDGVNTIQEAANLSFESLISNLDNISLEINSEQLRKLIENNYKDSPALFIQDLDKLIRSKLFESRELTEMIEEVLKEHPDVIIRDIANIRQLIGEQRIKSVLSRLKEIYPNYLFDILDRPISKKSTNPDEEIETVASYYSEAEIEELINQIYSGRVFGNIKKLIKYSGSDIQKAKERVLKAMDGYKDLFVAHIKDLTPFFSATEMLELLTPADDILILDNFADFISVPGLKEYGLNLLSRMVEERPIEVARRVGGFEKQVQGLKNKINILKAAIDQKDYVAMDAIRKALSKLDIFEHQTEEEMINYLEQSIAVYPELVIVMAPILIKENVKGVYPLFEKAIDKYEVILEGKNLPQKIASQEEFPLDQEEVHLHFLGITRANPNYFSIPLEKLEEIFFSRSFQKNAVDNLGWLRYANLISVATSVSHEMGKYGLAAEEENIDFFSELIFGNISSRKNMPISDKETQTHLFSHEETQFDNKITWRKILKPLGIDTNKTSFAKGTRFQGKENINKTNTLTFLKESIGNIWLYFNGHGSPEALAYAENQPGNFVASESPFSVNPMEVALNFSENQEASYSVFTFDACYTYDFTVNMYRQSSRIPDLTIGVSNKGKTGKGDPTRPLSYHQLGLTRRMREKTDNEPLTLKDMLIVESDPLVWKGEDPFVFLKLDEDQQELIEQYVKKKSEKEDVKADSRYLEIGRRLTSDIVKAV